MRWDRDAAALRPRLGISLQETRLSDKLTVHETVQLFRSFYPAGPTLDELLARVGLEEKRERLGRRSCPAGSGSGWRSRARSSATRSCCSSTSRPPASTRSRGGSCGT